MAVTIRMQGFNAAAAHLNQVAVGLNPQIVYILGAVGEQTARTARAFEQSHFLSGATYFSITAGERGSTIADVHHDGSETYVDVGVAEGDGPEQSASPQAYLQEFGYIHVGSGRWIQNPFLIPAAWL